MNEKQQINYLLHLAEKFIEYQKVISTSKSEMHTKVEKVIAAKQKAFPSNKKQLSLSKRQNISENTSSKVEQSKTSDRKQINKASKQVKLKQKEEIPHFSMEQLKEMRAKSPVTLKSIHMQAKLHNAIRQAKVWAAGKAAIFSEGTSANDVFKMGSPFDPVTKYLAFKPNNIGEPPAYFKVGKIDESATGVMEKLVWDIAVIMGIEEQFTPLQRQT